MITARSLQHIRYEFCANRRPGFILFILPRIGKIRYYSCDASGRCCLARIDHDEEFHEAIVDFAGGRGLEYEYCGEARQSVSLCL